MAEYCDHAECIVKNSPKELARLKTRGELTMAEYEILLQARTEQTSTINVPEASFSGQTPPDAPEIKGHLGTNDGSFRALDVDLEKAKEHNWSEAFKKRLEWLKVYRFPPNSP